MLHAWKTFLTCMVVVGLSLGCAGRNRGSGAIDGESFGAGATNPNRGPALALASSFRISDIPVPTGFQFDRAQSYVYQDRDRELGSMRYVGKAAVGTTTQFFLDEMVQYNWALVNVVEHKTVVLNFEKPDKTCMIMLTQAGRSGTEVRIDFRPRGVTTMQPTY